MVCECSGNSQAFAVELSRVLLDSLVVLPVEENMADVSQGRCAVALAVRHHAIRQMGDQEASHTRTLSLLRRGAVLIY